MSGYSSSFSPGAASQGQPSDGGSFVRIRTLNFAVEYAGIRVRETTTAEETITLVASKLRLDATERARRKIVMVYPLASDRARRGRARWRIRTLRADEALLPLRRIAAERVAARPSLFSEDFTFEKARGKASPKQSSSYFVPSFASTKATKAPVESRSTSEGFSREEVRFYLHDESSTPLDASEIPMEEDASGSESSEDERPPDAKFVADRQLLLAKRQTVKVGTLLKRSDSDLNLWRRRKVVLVDDRLWYWRDSPVARTWLAPPLADSGTKGASFGEVGQANTYNDSHRRFPSEKKTSTRGPPSGDFSPVTDSKAIDNAQRQKATPPKRRGSDSMLSFAANQQAEKPSQPSRLFFAAEDLEYDRLARSRAASVPLASNVVTEMSNRRDVPFGIKIETASRSLVFRAETRSQQLDWLEKLREGIDIATQNEYIALAELIIADEQKRHIDAEIQKFSDKHNPHWTFDFNDNHARHRQDDDEPDFGDEPR